MKAYVIRHIEFESLGNLEPELKKRGFTVQYFFAGNEDHLSYIEQTECDLLVVLGGPIGVYETEEYPFINSEKKIIELQIEKNKPVIGICLGCQLIASVLGARVYSSGKKEISWAPIKIFNSDSSPWLTSIQNRNVLHWHGDTFDIPNGATPFASTSDFPNQGFLYKNVLAIQFHLEAFPQDCEYWLLGHACEIAKTDGLRPQDIREQWALNAKYLQEAASHFWGGYLDQITQ